MEFQVGDRVACVVDHPSYNKYLAKGDTGTVCGLHGAALMVCWDIEIPNGHDCMDRCEPRHGWIVYRGEVGLEKSSDEPFEFDEEAFQALFASRQEA